MEITARDMATEILEWWEYEKAEEDLDLYGDPYPRWEEGDEPPIFVKMAAAVVGVEL